MAEVAKGIIDIEINTGSAASQLQALQTQINAFNLALNKSNKAQGTFAAEYSKELQAAINKTGLFTAETVKLSTAAATLDKTLSKGKTSLGQFFSAKFNKDSAIAAETMALAAERAKRLQTQFIATSGAANGFQEALAVRPLAAFSSEAAVAAQKTQILSNMFKQGTTQLINFGKNVQWAGRQLMVGFTVPLTIFGAMAGKTFMDLEKQMVAFRKVYGDITTTTADTNKNLEAVKGLAAEYTKYGIAVKDTISLAAQAAAAGRKDADLKDAVSQATRLATLGQMEQNAALETTISLQSAFRLSGQDLADTINFLNMVENQTVVSLQDIAAAIPRVAPVIQGLGGNVKDLTVFLAAMQEGGVDAAEGANALKSGLASLINPTKQAKDMLNGMGISLDSIIQKNKGDLMGTVMSFSEALQGLDQFSRQQALEQVFGKFQYAKLGALFDNISRKGSQAQQVIATMGYTTEQLGATADKELKIIEESFGVQLTAAVERFKLAIAPIGQLFVQLAIPVVNFITKIVDGFNSLSDGQKKFTAIGVAIVGVVIPALTMMAGLFLNLVGTLAKMSQGMALFTKGFITGGPIGAFKALSQSSKYLSLAEMDAAMAAQQLSGASQILNATLVEQVGTANAAATAIANLTRAYSAMIATQGAASSLPSFGIPGAAGNAAKGAKTGGIRIRGIRRNSGGGVPGSGNTDTVPAMLTPGEFVVNKEATKNNLGLLKAINNGEVQKFNRGGEVADIFGLRNIVNGFADIFGENLDSSRLIEEVVPKVKEAKVKGSSMTQEQKREASRKDPTFAHMQRNLVGGEGSIISGTQATKIFDEIARTGDLTPLERAYATALKPSGYSGSRITGNLGFDISPYLNSGKNNVDDLINDLKWRLQDGKNPYERMLLASGVSKQDVPRVSQDVHKRVLMRLEAMKRAGIQTFIDKDLYPSMEKIVPIAMKNAGVSEKSVGNLFTVSKVSDAKAIRWGGITQAVFKAAKSAGVDIEHLGGKYFRVGDLTQGTKGVSVRGTSSARGKVGGYAGPVLQLLKLLSGGVRKMASGGVVPGSGNSDKVPAMLTPGEFVVNKKAASQNQSLLEMMNGGEVKGYSKGGAVISGAGTAGQMAGMMTGNTPLMIAGTAMQLLGPSVLKLVKNFNGFGSMMKNAGPIIGRLSLGMTSMIGGVALAGFAIYKLNKSLNDAQKSGAKLSDAMYGSAEKTKAMGEAFGRESRAEASRRLAVEKAGGQQITQEAQAASGEFMKTDAASQMIKDLEAVKKSGEDVALALRNQLASSIVAGVISPEEAKAIAIDMGKELKDEKLSIKVAGQLSSLLGPNGEKLLTDPTGIIVAITPQIDKNKIKNDAQDAYNALNPLQEFGQLFKGGKEDFIRNFSIETISSQNASALAKEAEARAMLNAQVQEGTITLEQYIKAVGSLGEASKTSQKAVADANAQALGFADVAGMNSAANRMSDRQKQLDTNTGANGQALSAQQRNQLLNEGSQDVAGQKALDSANKIKEQLRTILKDSGYEDAAAQSIINGVEQGLASGRVGDAAALFAKVISGELRTTDVNMVARLKLEGNLDQAGLDDLIAKIDILRTDPEVDLKFNFNSVNTAKDINEIFSLYEQLQKNPDVTKSLFAEDKFTSVFKQFGIDYNQIAALPDLEQAIVTTNLQRYVDYKAIIIKDRVTDPSEVARDLRQLESTLGVNIKNVFKPKSKTDKQQDFSGMNGAGSGGKSGAQTLKQYIKEFEKATKAKIAYFNATKSMLGAEDQEILALIDTEMYLKANATQRKHLLDLAKDQLNIQKATAFLALSSQEKELQGLDAISKALDIKSQKDNALLRARQRDLELNNRALDKLAEKEDAVNKEYDTRIEALDKVEKANGRLAEQDRSRVDLASALASGNIADAANAANTMQQQSAQYQIEDARAALEAKRQEDLKNLTVSVNGVLMTRAQIEESNKLIQDQILVIEDAIYKIEDERFKNAQEREKLEMAIYLLQQKQNIEALRAQGLSGDQLKNLQALIDQYNAVAAAAQAAGVQTPGQAANTTVGAGNGSFTNPPPIDASGASTAGAATPAAPAAPAPTYDYYTKAEFNAGIKDSKVSYGKGSEQHYIARKMGYSNPTAETVKADTMDNKYAGFEEAKKQEITDLVKQARASTKKAFSGYYAGGLIPGAGAMDSISTKLTPGEFVIRKSMVEKYGIPLLEALNMGSFRMPGMHRPSVPTNNFLDGIGSPRYSIPEQNIGAVPISNVSSSQASSMYNSTYNVNVNVSGTNASPDDIANVVMAKLSQQNRGNLRSNRY